MASNPYALNPFTSGSGYTDQYTNLPKSYDSQGYVNTFQVPEAGANPWSSLVGQQSTALSNSIGAMTQIPGIQAGIEGQQAAMAQYGQATAYPSFPNSAGLGSQQPFSAPATTPAAADPGSSSRGFNPWSLQGEANSR